MTINFINSSYRRFYSAHRREINRAINKCLSKGELTLRKDVWDLEKNISDFIGTKYAVGVGSGTDALFLSLLALGIGKGDEVITVSNTFIATIQAIVHTGATPILIDVGEDEQMDVNQLEKAITQKTKAIIPVHYTGMMCNMERIVEITKGHGLYLVEDACQALGSSQLFYKQFDEGKFPEVKKAGSFGKLGCFSFNTAKLLGGLCDGGCVVTDDRELYEKICLLRNHWNVHQLSVDRNDYPQPEKMEWAWKSRLSNVNAAFLNVKFKYLPEILKRREDIADRYNNELDYRLGLPDLQEGRIWQEYHLRVPTREDFSKFLAKKGIETLTRDIVPNHKLKGLNLEHFNLPVTERLAAEVLRLPLYPELTNQEISYIIKNVNEYKK